MSVSAPGWVIALVGGGFFLWPMLPSDAAEGALLVPALTILIAALAQRRFAHYRDGRVQAKLSEHGKPVQAVVLFTEHGSEARGLTIVQYRSGNHLMTGVHRHLDANPIDGYHFLKVGDVCQALVVHQQPSAVLINSKA